MDGCGGMVLQEGQVLGRKTLADVVEALVGTYLLNGGLDSALTAIAWLGVPIHFPSKVPEAVHANHVSKTSCRNLLQLADFEALEEKLGYRFRNKALLVSAFDYGYESGTKLGGFEFHRLEVLGDTVLDFLITRYLVQKYPGFNPASLNDLKQATINGENFACIALHHGLHIYLQKVSPILETQIEVFATSFWKEGGSAFGITNLSSPRAVGDVVQTLAAAIFLDADLDIETVWKVHEPLLQPLATPETVMLHPRRQLESLCLNQGWHLEVQSSQQDGIVQAHVFINRILLGSSQSKERNVARRLAAFKALRSLSSQTTNAFQCGPKS
jgi:endoribonuclease Dicer